jgi:hypothetical protein
MFPTPRSEDSQSCGAHKGTPDTLTAFMKMWPTPRAGNPGSRPNGKGGKILSEEVRKSLWPTPKGSPSGPDFARMNREGSGGDDLATAVARENFPTPSCMDHIERKGMRPSRAATGRTTGYLSETVSGQLNPTWVEWLMGWPLGWTDLKPLGMDKFREWLQQHGRF